MTNKEAIEVLKPLFEQCKGTDTCLGYIEHFFSKDEETALDLAIKDLEEKAKNEKYGSELARIVAEHDEVMSREIGSFECDGKCDDCKLGVPIDGQFYDDGTPIHECSIPVEKNPRDLTDWELERFMAHGHPICDCEQKCDKCPEWMANICNNYDYYEKKYKKGDDK